MLAARSGVGELAQTNLYLIEQHLLDDVKEGSGNLVEQFDSAWALRE